ncbi:hypothetical protein [Pseudomonas sp. H9]|uniref:hypothetical protein n=1 Tax=Pseudomonas sp. H9 TaxID=483968 RepID=UPI001057B2F1|nr:hypothetical protein [Pseudomonas sp. H9]TDF86366.1 hypothetical protein E1573_02010 [Pseudomonas sp. H9]
MTVTLSHGPWAITLDTPGDVNEACMSSCTLKEKNQINPTYRFDWKDQSLAGVSHCRYSFAHHEAPGATTWQASDSQRAWYSAAPVAAHPVWASPVYRAIELNVSYAWRQDEQAAQVTQNWHDVHLQAPANRTVASAAGDCLR